MTDKLTKRLGLIGSGNMAEAIIKGLLKSNILTPEQIITSDVNRKRLDFISSHYGVNTTDDNKKVVKSADLIILAVKPDTIGKVLNEIKELINSTKIIISIAAGITTSFISKTINKRTKVVRVMPNTPALVLSGASVLYFNTLLNNNEKIQAKRIFESIGIVEIVENEYLLDAVTGLSGSGPAFVAMFIEALLNGGVKMGLSKDLALRIAAQTVYGTAKLVLEEGIHPAELKEKVSSPAGTTIEGIHQLELHGFRGAVISAVEAATLRSKQLSKGG